MTRVIHNLKLSTWQSARQLLPRLGKTDYEDVRQGICDVILSDAAILKAYDDEIILDLGGEYVIIRSNEFSSITIR